MPQFARPDSTVTAGTWNPGGGATLWETVDEVSPDDNDYDSSGFADGDMMELGLSNLIDPLSSSGHIIRFRAADTQGGFGDVSVALKQGLSQIAAYDPGPLGPSITLYTYTLSGAEADSITDYNDLRLNVIGIGSSSIFVFTWAELEVPIAGSVPPPVKQRQRLAPTQRMG